jgi:hypothetical protein
MSSVSSQPVTSTALATLDQQITLLDTIARECNVVAIAQEGGQFSSALALADKIQMLREALTPEVMKRLMALQGNPLGFRTDRDTKGGYEVAVIRDVFIEATFKGFKLTQNETNVISGRFYGTKEGFEARMRDFAKAGLMTDLKIIPGVPKTQTSGAEVHMRASWRWKGQPDTMEVDIPVKTDQYSSADQILGKARRKILAAIYSRVTGTEVSEGEVGDVDTMKRVEPLQTHGTGANTKSDPSDSTVQQLSPEIMAKMDETVGGDNEGETNLYLIDVGWIKKGQTWRDLSEKRANQILAKKDSFLEAAGIKKPSK